MSDSGRQRLRPWLEAKISSGSIEGLYWWNEEKTMFRIPWKHGGKQDWAPEHSVVFREWAIHTGKFREGLDPPEYAKWKTRLRCAFNKAPDIREHKRLSELDGPNPFKIYEFLPRNRDVIRTTTSHRTNVANSPETPEQSAYGNQAQVLPGVLDQFNNSLRSGSLPSDLVGIPSGDLVRGPPLGDPADSTMLSTSLPSFNDNFGPAGMPIESGAAPVGAMCAEEQYGAQRNSNSPLPGATAPQSVSPAHSPYSYTASPSPGAVSENVSSPAMSDSTYLGSPATPARSDISSTSSGTVHLRPSATESLTWECRTASPPALGDLSTAGQDVFPGADLDGWVLRHPPESGPVSNTHSHLVVAPGTLETYLVTPIPGQGDGVAPYKVVVTEVNDLPNPLQGHELHVRMQYMTSIVEERWVTSVDGCRIYYGSDADIRAQASDNVSQQLLGPETACQLHFPPCHGLVSGARQLQLTEILLNCMQRGVIVEADRGDIYATRFCKCVVNVSNQQHPEGIKLQRNERTKVFDYHSYFLPCLRAHMTGGAQRPSPETLLTFGQQHNYMFPTEHVLVSATVLSAAAYQNLSEVNIKPEVVAEVDMEISTSDEFDRQVFSFIGSGTAMD